MFAEGRQDAGSSLTHAGNLTRFADVFSYGVLLWELYCCRSCWVYGPQGRLVTRRGFPHLPPECPRPYAQLVGSCLQPAHRQRPNFKQIGAMLESMQMETARAAAANSGGDWWMLAQQAPALPPMPSPPSALPEVSPQAMSSAPPGPNTGSSHSRGLSQGGSSGGGDGPGPRYIASPVGVAAVGLQAAGPYAAPYASPGQYGQSPVPYGTSPTSIASSAGFATDASASTAAPAAARGADGGCGGGGSLAAPRFDNGTGSYGTGGAPVSSSGSGLHARSSTSSELVAGGSGGTGSGTSVGAAGGGDRGSGAISRISRQGSGGVPRGTAPVAGGSSQPSQYSRLSRSSYNMSEASNTSSESLAQLPPTLTPASSLPAAPITRPTSADPSAAATSAAAAAIGLDSTGGIGGAAAVVRDGPTGPLVSATRPYDTDRLGGGALPSGALSSVTTYRTEGAALGDSHHLAATPAAAAAPPQAPPPGLTGGVTRAFEIPAEIPRFARPDLPTVPEVDDEPSSCMSATRGSLSEEAMACGQSWGRSLSASVKSMDGTYGEGAAPSSTFFTVLPSILSVEELQRSESGADIGPVGSGSGVAAVVPSHGAADSATGHDAPEGRLESASTVGSEDGARSAAAAAKADSATAESAEKARVNGHTAPVDGAKPGAAVPTFSRPSLHSIRAAAAAAAAATGAAPGAFGAPGAGPLWPSIAAAANGPVMLPWGTPAPAQLLSDGLNLDPDLPRFARATHGRRHDVDDLTPDLPGPVFTPLPPGPRSLSLSVDSRSRGGSQQLLGAMPSSSGTLGSMGPASASEAILPQSPMHLSSVGSVAVGGGGGGSGSGVFGSPLSFSSAGTPGSVAAAAALAGPSTWRQSGFGAFLPQPSRMGQPAPAAPAPYPAASAGQLQAAFYSGVPMLMPMPQGSTPPPPAAPQQQPQQWIPGAAGVLGDLGSGALPVMGLAAVDGPQMMGAPALQHRAAASPGVYVSPASTVRSLSQWNSGGAAGSQGNTPGDAGGATLADEVEWGVRPDEGTAGSWQAPRARHWSPSRATYGHGRTGRGPRSYSGPPSLALPEGGAGASSSPRLAEIAWLGVDAPRAVFGSGGNGAAGGGQAAGAGYVAPRFERASLRSLESQGAIGAGGQAPAGAGAAGGTGADDAAGGATGKGAIAASGLLRAIKAAVTSSGGGGKKHEARVSGSGAGEEGGAAAGGQSAPHFARHGAHPAADEDDGPATSLPPVDLAESLAPAPAGAFDRSSMQRPEMDGALFPFDAISGVLGGVPSLALGRSSFEDALRIGRSSLSTVPESEPDADAHVSQEGGAAADAGSTEAGEGHERGSASRSGSGEVGQRAASGDDDGGVRGRGMQDGACEAGAESAGKR
ncbi:hypothetical protein GPECTOR_2g1267 [Gonium pectorale]|uniref:Serine-threonine/tyrosine-protein kinase catalytic domain-containing protein n=1 Tax=Gonium pectorale TaxID=33097 RepID=A0A150H0M7_GONPE|nr:hypothetical protein GPECTOR_2g1267 [Gonium pectorale]|eukprot:KXZ55717.1 hypothetical protein GPECTOR_2g1267 [Gonium pectorale]